MCPEFDLTEINQALAQEDSSIVPTPLQNVPSAREVDRRSYLVKDVCNRYYAGNDQFVDRYFGSGDSWYYGSA